MNIQREQHVLIIAYLTIREYYKNPCIQQSSIQQICYKANESFV